MQRDFPGYGYQRVTRELRHRELVVNHTRVQRVMQAMLRPPVARRRPWVVAEPDAVTGTWYPNRRAGLVPTGPNQLWVADLTYVRLERSFLFVAVVLDVFSRKVIGYAIGPPLDARLPLAALDAAITSRTPPAGCRTITRIAARNTHHGATANACRTRGCLGRCRELGTGMTMPTPRAS